jgi:hypothetical protein
LAQGSQGQARGLRHAEREKRGKLGADGPADVPRRAFDTRSRIPLDSWK